MASSISDHESYRTKDSLELGKRRRLTSQESIETKGIAQLIVIIAVMQYLVLGK